MEWMLQMRTKGLGTSLSQLPVQMYLEVGVSFYEMNRALHSSGKPVRQALEETRFVRLIQRVKGLGHKSLTDACSAPEK